MSLSLVQSFPSEADAFFYQGLLGEIGVEADVIPRYTRHGQPYADLKILDEHNLEKAMKVISDHIHNNEKIVNIMCLKCSECVPANYAICWNCGTNIRSQAI